MRRRADQIFPVELQDGLKLAALSVFLLWEALVIPDSWGWPWVFASVGCLMAVAMRLGAYQEDEDAV